MLQKQIEEVLGQFNIPNKEMEQAVNYVKELEEYLKSIGHTLDHTDVGTIQTYVSILIEQHKNEIPRIRTLARFFYARKQHDIYIYFTQLFNSLGVVDSILERVEQQEGIEIRKKIESELTHPSFGTSIKKLPEYTNDLMNKLERYLSKPACQKVLAGNNHRIPKEAMLEEKKYYEQANSLDQYLLERHQRKVKELQYHYDNDIIWYEQIISKEAIEYVESNQEILSAVRKGEELFITKIPYAIDAYLNATTDQDKKYHACHCSFVKEAIHNRDNISYDWCYCSAGFAKFPFEVIFDKELPVRLIKTPLKGDTVCQFAIDISNIEYKK